MRMKKTEISKIFTITLIMMLSISGITILLPIVAAQDVEYNLNLSEIGGGRARATPSEGDLPNGTVVTLTATPNSGYKFAYWEGDLRGSTNPVNITMTKDYLIYAIFQSDPPLEIPTFAYVSTSPRTVGVGEYTLIVFWLDKYPPTAGGLGGDQWENWMIDITKPDGGKQTLGPFRSGPIASTWTQFTPDQVGDYTIVFSWPGQVLGRGTEPPRIQGLSSVGNHYLAATSDPITLTVTETPAEKWSEPPIPTGYWERPISSANRGWVGLASNWLKGSWLVNDFQTAGQAPNSGHILWTRQVISGGIPDQSFGANHGQTTDYENFFSDPIIMNGKVYYNHEMYPNYGFYCLDLDTGEEIWYKNGTDIGIYGSGSKTGDSVYAGLGGAGVYSGYTFDIIDFAQMFSYYGLNGAGTMSHLWMTTGSTWHMLEADTGNWVMSLVNVPGGSTITDPSGSIVRYTYSSSTGNFLGWNVTQAIGPPSPSGTGQQQWEPRQGHVIDAVEDTTWMEWGPRNNVPPEFIAEPRSGYTMNCTGPTGLTGGMSVVQDINRNVKMFFGQSTPDFTADSFSAWAVRINDGGAYSPHPELTSTQNSNLGYSVTLLWEKDIPYPLNGYYTWSTGAVSYEDDIFILENKETIQKWGYSLSTGNLVWGPTVSEDAWNMYGQSNNYAYGNLYGVGYGGHMYCYDMKTGELKWTYEAPGVGYESPYGDYPLSIGAIADGKVYLYSTEHSPTTPLWRGSYLRCVDAYTGEELWKVLNFVTGMALADGRIIAGDWYDQRMYCYGKGPSATTVSLKNDVITEGSSIMITGSVTDQSPGAKGTAAIADEHMDAWMEYLYKGQAMPAGAVGVTVKLSTYDPNGNYQDIGTTTVDQHGNFGKSWVPPVPGDYYILAEFEGSDSYGSSSATTYITVDEAPEATPPPEATPAPPTETYIAGSTIAIIAAIAVVAFLILRKK